MSRTMILLTITLILRMFRGKVVGNDLKCISLLNIFSTPLLNSNDH